MFINWNLRVTPSCFFPECLLKALPLLHWIIQFSKTVEMIGFPEKRLEIYNSFSGVYENETYEIRSLQLDSLLDLPVKLGRLKHVIFGDSVDLFEFDTVFTLFEFIDGIAWELSFHVIPTQCEIRR